MSNDRHSSHRPPVGQGPELPDREGLIRKQEGPGLRPGQFVQSPPLLFTRDGHAVYLGDMYRGRAAFLVAGGPSFASVDHDLLRGPGCLTLGLNNSPKTFRPDLWICVDNPPRFLKSIWLDPRIMKFVPYCFAEHAIFDNEAWEITDVKVGDCPNVLFYRRNGYFNAENFLFEDTVNWGDNNQRGGHRSVLLAALRILFFLGIRDVFLLGVDFRMEEDRKYHFEENRNPASIEWNQGTYQSLIEKFKLLRPIFEQNGFRVHNCNPASELKVFPFIDLRDAVEKCREGMPKVLAEERTEGLYERDPLRRMYPPAVLRPEEIAAAPPGLDCGMEELGIVVGCDSQQEWLLPWWFEKYSTHNRFAVTFVDFGMSPGSRDWCRERGVVVDLPDGLPEVGEAWFYKAWMFRLCNQKKLIGIDLDCEVRGSLQPIFDLIGDRIVLAPDCPMGEYAKVFVPGIFFNSGVVGVSRDNPLLATWEEETLRKHPHFRSDQEILNFVLYQGGVEVVALPDRYNRLRLAGDSNDAVVMHWTGPDGKDHIRSGLPGMPETC